jgi:DNA-binding protein Fis
MTLHELGELYTEQVLQHTGGNKIRAARILGIDRKTLYRRAEREARGDTRRKET